MWLGKGGVPGGVTKHDDRRARFRVGRRCICAVANTV
jgi:hypothetical protein